MNTGPCKLPSENVVLPKHYSTKLDIVKPNLEKLVKKVVEAHGQDSQKVIRLHCADIGIGFTMARRR